ncbi:MAG: hypothetical protein AAGH60_12425 [Pseudomonadota bacterium]
MGKPVASAPRCVAILASLALAACFEAPQTSDMSESAAAVETGINAQEDAPPTLELAPDARQIIPGREANAPTPGEPLERVAAVAAPVVPLQPVSLGIVVVDDANRIETRRGAVILSGTQAIDRQAVCPQADGRTPLCWVLARTAVRRLIGQRAVECTLAEREDASQDHNAPCTLGPDNLAELVIGSGWAFAAEGAAASLREAEQSAREAGLGLWGMQRQ